MGSKPPPKLYLPELTEDCNACGRRGVGYQFQGKWILACERCETHTPLQWTLAAAIAVWNQTERQKRLAEYR